MPCLVDSKTIEVCFFFPAPTFVCIAHPSNKPLSNGCPKRPGMHTQRNGIRVVAPCLQHTEQNYFSYFFGSLSGGIPHDTPHELVLVAAVLMCRRGRKFWSVRSVTPTQNNRTFEGYCYLLFIEEEKTTNNSVN